MLQRARLLIVLALLGACLSLPSRLVAQSVPSTPSVVEFTPDRWDLRSATLVDHLGRKALTGTAFLKDVSFDDGIIECDVAMKAGVRAYPGVLFRVRSADDYERIYLRPHRAPLFDDAIQYVAAANGIDSWQLHHGPGKTAAAVLPTDRWLHLRIEVLGTQARVFLDNAPEPALLIGTLGHGRSAGGLGLMTVTGDTAFFSNFSYRKDPSLRFPPPPVSHVPPGIVANWEVSRSFTRRQVDLDAYPAADVLAGPWTPLAARHDGIVDISQVRGRTNAEPEVVFVRTSIRAEAAGPRKYWLGYSDEASVFVNRRLVFQGDSTYRSRDTSFLGVVGPYDGVSLPLERGENEVIFAVAESNGGWGILLQDASAIGRAEGVEVMWTTSPDFPVPESAAYDPATDAFYVSHFDAYHPSRGEPRQAISKLSRDGRVVARDWVSGLSNPTGLAVRGGRLFAVERGHVAEIDIASASIVRRVPIPGAMLPNDIAIAPNGDLFVSDSRRSAIYRIAGEQLEVWLADRAIASPNGLIVRGKQLIVGTNGDGCLKVIDLETKQIDTIANLGRGLIDGIGVSLDGALLVSHNEGRLLRVELDGRVTTVLDTTATRTSIADFAYVPEHEMIVFPTFVGGRVIAYRLPR